MTGRALFHFQTGFSIACEQNGYAWDIEKQPVRTEGPLRVQMQTGDVGADEIHLLLSVTQSVEQGYEEWRRSSGSSSALQFHFVPKKGSSHEVLDKYDGVDAALQVAEAILSVPPRANVRRIRIFCAGPVAFALALGRTINTWGEVVTMYYSKALGMYFESFRFRA